MSINNEKNRFKNVRNIRLNFMQGLLNEFEQK